MSTDISQQIFEDSSYYSFSSGAELASFGHIIEGISQSLHSLTQHIQELRRLRWEVCLQRVGREPRNALSAVPAVVFFCNSHHVLFNDLFRQWVPPGWAVLVGDVRTSIRHRHLLIPRSLPPAEFDDDGEPSDKSPVSPRTANESPKLASQNDKIIPQRHDTLDNLSTMLARMAASSDQPRGEDATGSQNQHQMVAPSSIGTYKPNDLLHSLLGCRDSSDDTSKSRTSPDGPPHHKHSAPCDARLGNDVGISTKDQDAARARQPTDVEQDPHPVEDQTSKPSGTLVADNACLSDSVPTKQVIHDGGEDDKSITSDSVSSVRKESIEIKVTTRKGTQRQDVNHGGIRGGASDTQTMQGVNDRKRKTHHPLGIEDKEEVVRARIYGRRRSAKVS